MDLALRQRVRARAGNRCEYCHIHQDDEPFFRFHIEHVIPRQHQGGDDASNLALACYHCNLHKGPNLTAIDERTTWVVPLFNPRRQRWSAHFALRGAAVRGLSPTGRATLRLLAMNEVARVELRRASAGR